MRIIEPGSPVDGLTSCSADIEAEEITIPASEEEARLVIEKFERGAQSLRSDQGVADNVVQHMLSDTTGLRDEKWEGTREEELQWCVDILSLIRRQNLMAISYVSELIYIHAKVMIVDDRRVIVSALYHCRGYTDNENRWALRTSMTEVKR